MNTSRWPNKWIVLSGGLLVIGLCQWALQTGLGLAQQTEPGHRHSAHPEGRTAAPVHIDVFGNQLVVTSEDPDTLRRAAELVRHMTTGPAGPGDFEVIQLKRGNAVAAAKRLDEKFNGPKVAAKSAGPGANKGEFQGPGDGFPDNLPAAGAPVIAREDRIQVRADPSTNSLFVKATPVDIHAIRDLVDKQLDVEVVADHAAVTTHPPIPLKNMRVTDAYVMVRDLLRETKDIDSDEGGIGEGGIGGGFASIYAGTTKTILNMDPTGNPKGVLLHMSYDKDANSLIVTCPAPMYEDIRVLIEQMDAAALHHKPASLFLQRIGSAPSMRFKMIVREEEDLVARPVTFRAGKLPKELPSWFTKLDTDNDGQVALHEWRKGGKDISKFREWDRNNDGFITPEEALYKQRLIQMVQGTGTFNGVLSPDDMRDTVRGKPCRIYYVRMIQGRTYVIDLRSRQFDSFLRLEDSAMRQLAQDDDSGGNLDARITFRCPRSDTYRVIATSVGGGQGAYTLSIREN